MMPSREIKKGAESQRMEVTIREGTWTQFSALDAFKGQQFATFAQVDAYVQAGHKCQTVRTDTFLVYAAPGKPLGKKIEFAGQVFYVPEKYQGLVDHALVLSYSKINAEKKSDGIYITGDVVKTIEIPKSNGWYEDIDTETGIPKGKICSEKNPSARFWGRAKEKDAYCQFIGAVVHRYDLKRGVEARYYPTFVFGMALLKPAGPGTEEVVVQAPPDYTLLLRRIATAKTHIKNMRRYTKPRIIKTFEELIREVEELIRQD